MFGLPEATATATDGGVAGRVDGIALENEEADSSDKGGGGRQPDRTSW